MAVGDGIDLRLFGHIDQGAGTPIVFLHSSGLSKSQWRRFWEPWTGRYRLLAVDLWGYGETPMPEKAADFGLDDEVELVERLLESVDEPLHLVGHSYGGAVALRFALRFGDRVRSVCVHEPVLFHLLEQAGQTEGWMEIRQLCNQMLAAMDRGENREACRVFVDYWNGSGAWDSLSADKQARTEASARKTRFDLQALFGERTPVEDYAALAEQALVTVGERTRLPARLVAELLAGQLGAYEGIPGVGHMAPVTAPALVRPVFERWIESR